MQIRLQHMVPVPLKEKILQRQSDVWNRDVRFAKGEWVKIKAPSGTGKTTLIHSIYKLRGDYTGDVFWDDKKLSQITADELALRRQKDVSIIFQDLRLFGHLTGKENIELNRVLQTPVYDSSVIDTMADQLGISSVLHQKASLCSYGEQQRIAIIRALVQPFSWLLMDEPFSHLDAANTAKAAKLIGDECAKRGAGFLLTDLDEDNHFSYHKYLQL